MNVEDDRAEFLPAALEGLTEDQAQRVRAALGGELDTELLDDAESDRYELITAMPGNYAEQTATERRTAGGDVGYNEAGELVRGLPGGEEEPI